MFQGHSTEKTSRMGSRSKVSDGNVYVYTEWPSGTSFRVGRVKMKVTARAVNCTIIKYWAHGGGAVTFPTLPKSVIIWQMIP